MKAWMGARAMRPSRTFAFATAAAKFLISSWAQCFSKVASKKLLAKSRIRLLIGLFDLLSQHWLQQAHYVGRGPPTKPRTKFFS